MVWQAVAPGCWARELEHTRAVGNRPGTGQAGGRQVGQGRGTPGRVSGSVRGEAARKPRAAAGWP